MSVRIRMKKMGRTHRPFFRICAMDKRAPRDGRVLEELGTYDPMVPETDARAVFKKERVAYWLSVGAQPSEKVAVLIKKYGEGGTHLDAQREALDRLAMGREVPDPGEPASLPKDPAAEAKAAEEAAAAEAAAAEQQAAEEQPAADESGEAAPGEQAAAEEPAAEEKPAE
ncbi:MAG: 30S ribosomal protein S16 [Planctomycetales bacterium]|nr:30S ribosomal protein S16 [Planctomycetales bacterium]